MNINYSFIEKVLDKIFPLPEKFGVGADNEDVEMIEYDLQQNIDEDIQIFHGISKMVIVAPALGDIVIKIPFNGQYSYRCRYNYFHHSNRWVSNRWVDETESEKPIEFDYFCGASGADETDYCLAEYEKYQELRDHALDCFVAKTLFYGIRDGVRIFLQEKAMAADQSSEKPLPSKNSLKIAHEYQDNNNYAYMDFRWVANCIDRYGKGITERFLHYASETDEEILGDMHDGNYGYRDDGSPVLLDFSDFHS